MTYGNLNKKGGKVVEKRGRPKKKKSELKNINIHCRLDKAQKSILNKVPGCGNTAKIHELLRYWEEKHCEIR